MEVTEQKIINNNQKKKYPSEIEDGIIEIMQLQQHRKNTLKKVNKVSQAYRRIKKYLTLIHLSFFWQGR